MSRHDLDVQMSQFFCLRMSVLSSIELGNVPMVPSAGSLFPKSFLPTFPYMEITHGKFGFFVTPSFIKMNDLLKKFQT